MPTLAKPHTGDTAPPPNRRHALTLLGVLGSTGALGLLGCGGGGDDGESSGSASSSSGASSNSSGGSSTTTTNTCSVAPEETAGPYPADGSTASSRSYNVLALPGIVRSDIRSSIGSTTQVGGAPLTLEITLTGTLSNCSPLEGYAIYLWHCTADGNYSVYTTQNVADNQLRGVQASDADGKVRFTTIVPGCYAGRMPHMHLEVYPSIAAATGAANKLKTTQLAFPTDTIRQIYASSSAYSASIPNLNAISFATDNVFSDGVDLEMTTLSGSASAGYTASITLSIAA